jgi:glyoxylate reductase
MKHIYCLYIIVKPLVVITIPKPKLFITRELPGGAIEKLRKYYEVEVWDKPTPPPRDVLLSKTRDIDALGSLLTDKIDKELIDGSPRLRIIAQYAVGYDNIDVNYATAKGIYVTNTPGVLTDATADLTFALILAVARRIIEAHDFVVSGKWWESKVAWHPSMMLGIELRGKTIGIIGMGRIGKAVARRALGFGMNVVYYDRGRLPEHEEELKARYLPLEELLKISDIVTVHIPLTQETRHLIREEHFKLMKRTAIFINTSRGGVVKTEDLVKALENKWIYGAGLDVFEEEPLQANHPLTKLPNVVLTPHIGSATWEARIAMADAVAENLIAFYEGRIPPNLVNPDVVRMRRPGF